jgi:hypothetical protein
MRNPSERQCKLVDDVAHALATYFNERPGNWGCSAQAAVMLIEAGPLKGYTAGDFFSEAIVRPQQKPARTRHEPDQITEFLRNSLSQGPVPQREIEECGRARGFSVSQLDRAKKRGGIVAFKEKIINGRWFWAFVQHTAQSAATDTRQ